MIKNILVALDGSEHARAALQYALWVAERFRAALWGLHIIDIIAIEGPFFQDISGALGFEPYFDMSGKVRDLSSRASNSHPAYSSPTRSTSITTI